MKEILDSDLLNDTHKSMWRIPIIDVKFQWDKSCKDVPPEKISGVINTVMNIIAMTHIDQLRAIFIQEG